MARALDENPVLNLNFHTQTHTSDRSLSKNTHARTQFLINTIIECEIYIGIVAFAILLVLSYTQPVYFGAYCFQIAHNDVKLFKCLHISYALW